MKRLTVLFFIFAATIIVPAQLAGQDQSATGSGASTPDHPRTTHMTDPSLLHTSTLTAKAPDVYQVKFKTTKGDFMVQVNRDWSPIGADRFYNLVKHGFFTDAA